MLRELFYDSKTSSRLENRFGRRYKSNDIIFKEDDKGNDMYFIVSGSVRLSRMGQILKVMQRGEYFGEMSLLIGIQRTMTAQAEEDNTRVIAVNTENFETLLREEPKIAILLLRELANRIKDTDERFIK
ncbi:MAG: cyclic nucleotide-binding domain-containing protein [Nitrospirae bacterium]|nr:cyclic nucleotide-binding domain-containing protein [Nitrospirota bacterium]